MTGTTFVSGEPLDHFFELPVTELFGYSSTLFQLFDNQSFDTSIFDYYLFPVYCHGVYPVYCHGVYVNIRVVGPLGLPV